MSDISTDAPKTAWEKTVAAFKAAFATLPHLAVDAIGLGGGAGITYAAWQIYTPAAYAIGGTGMVVLAWLLGKRMK